MYKKGQKIRAVTKRSYFVRKMQINVCLIAMENNLRASECFSYTWEFLKQNGLIMINEILEFILYKNRIVSIYSNTFLGHFNFQQQLFID